LAPGPRTPLLPSRLFIQQIEHVQAATSLLKSGANHRGKRLQLIVIALVQIGIKPAIHLADNHGRNSQNGQRQQNGSHQRQLMKESQPHEI
jgi:hypothetical protein